MRFFEWFFGAENEVIDLEIIQTDLVDIVITDEERNLTGALDDRCERTIATYKKDPSIPIGKQVR